MHRNAGRHRGPPGPDIHRASRLKPGPGHTSIRKASVRQGTYLRTETNAPGWWGEGEVKSYSRGSELPTICGHGTGTGITRGARGPRYPGTGYGQLTPPPTLEMAASTQEDGRYYKPARFGQVPPALSGGGGGWRRFFWVASFGCGSRLFRGGAFLGGLLSLLFFTGGISPTPVRFSTD